MTVRDRGREGVKNHRKKRDILYGRPHRTEGRER